MSELEKQLFQAPEEWFEVHLLGGELECTHLTKEATQALLSLYQKELEDQVKEEVGRILFTLPPEARKHLEPYLQAGLKRIEQELTGEQP